MCMHLELVAAKKYLELLCRASPCEQTEHGLQNDHVPILHMVWCWGSAYL